VVGATGGSGRNCDPFIMANGFADHRLSFSVRRRSPRFLDGEGCGCDPNMPATKGNHVMASILAGARAGEKAAEAKASNSAAATAAWASSREHPGEVGATIRPR
jgi:hypothetical protein